MRWARLQVMQFEPAAGQSAVLALRAAVVGVRSFRGLYAAGGLTVRLIGTGPAKLTRFVSA